MKKVCYFCNTHLGEIGGNHTNETFYSICDGCEDRLGLEKRLPELLLAIVALRKKNGFKSEYHQTFTIPAVIK